jgi:hypothetical protein
MALLALLKFLEEARELILMAQEAKLLTPRMVPLAHNQWILPQEAKGLTLTVHMPIAIPMVQGTQDLRVLGQRVRKLRYLLLRQTIPGLREVLSPSHTHLQPVAPVRPLVQAELLMCKQLTDS